MKHCCLRLIAIVLLCVYVRSANADSEVDFNRDIRPILSDTCFKCHGPDAAERHADLRLDSKQGIADAASLLSAADPANSEFLRRIFTHDEDEMMPPPESGRKLTESQKENLRSWVEQGAVWENHWSFVPPAAPQIPSTDRPEWVSNEIDSFVLRKLSENNLRPNKTADRLTLIRRLSLDLLGLPPSPELIKKFTETKSARWYEELVEDLFRSPHYGEHMARFWLDAARYGDTHGLHLDNYREMWLYRDWVVRAFNENLPYDVFVTEQLAGDLLESPTEAQLIATGFNRSHVTTAEGGSIAEEVKVRNVVDRVATTGTVFMGLTVGCAQCHDHKYDPISQEEFYSLYAFFNSLEANPLDGNRKDHAPVLRYFDEQQKRELDELKKKSAAKKKEIDSLIAGFKYADPRESMETSTVESKITEHLWVDDDLPNTKNKNGWRKVDQAKHKPFSGKVSFVGENTGFTQMHLEKAEPRLRFSEKDKLFAHVFIDPENVPKQIMLQFNDGNWEHRAYWGEDLINFGTDGTPSRLRLGDVPEAGKWIRLEVNSKDVGFNGKAAIHGIAFSQHGGKVYWDAAGVVTAVAQKADPKSYLAWKSFERESGAIGLPRQLKDKFLKSDESIEDQLFDYYLRNVNPDSKALIAKPQEDANSYEKSISTMNQTAPTTLIWREKKTPDKAFVLNRGEYDQKGAEVQRETPRSLPAFDKSYTRDRLGLARWLLAKDHPLTARVAVNRFWQQFFGTGIVATAEDFGAQGAAPTHPELLDWLAVEFRTSGWDVKGLVKKIVMSSTYRQKTNANGQKLALDPANQLFSRGPRFRLDAEMLRDQALAVSDLLVYSIGGPSVKPPQPSGLWYAVGYSGSNTVRFKKDSGHEKVHRRSLYTFWKRTSPPPQMSTFDAPSRESCLVRRERTNTPLQALLLMNDPQYVEAARYLAQLALNQNHETIEQDIRFMYEKAMGKPVNDSTFRILLDNAYSNLAEYIKAPDTAKELIKIGEVPADEKYDFIQLASLTMLANLIMNQDEFVTKN